MSNNPFTEIGAIVVAVVLVIAGGLLLYAGKIDTAVPALMFILAAWSLGMNGALKAPSSTQQEILNKQQDNLQNLINLLASHTHPVPPTPPSTPTQPVQPAPSPFPAGTPDTVTTNAPATPSPIYPGVSMTAYQTGMMPAVTPPAAQPGNAGAKTRSIRATRR